MTTYRRMYTYFFMAFLYCNQFKAFISFIKVTGVFYPENVEISNILCYEVAMIMTEMFCELHLAPVR